MRTLLALIVGLCFVGQASAQCANGQCSINYQPQFQYPVQSFPRVQYFQPVAVAPVTQIQVQPVQAPIVPKVEKTVPVSFTMDHFSLVGSSNTKKDDCGCNGACNCPCCPCKKPDVATPIAKASSAPNFIVPSAPVAVNVRYSGNRIGAPGPGEHSHTCHNCGTTFSHNGNDPMASHNCPRCGTYENVVSRFGG